MVRRRVQARGRRTTVAAVVLGGMVSLAAACGAEDPDTEAPIGAVVRSERMNALNLAIVTDDGETGTLVGTFVNEADEEDALTGVTVDTEEDTEGGPVEAYLLDGDVALPTDETVRLAPEQRVALRGSLPKGRFVEVTLELEDSRTLSTLVPVEPPTGPYDDVEIPSTDDIPSS